PKVLTSPRVRPSAPRPQRRRSRHHPVWSTARADRFSASASCAPAWPSYLTRSTTGIIGSAPAAAAAPPEAAAVPRARIGQRSDVCPRSRGRRTEEHPIAGALDPHPQRVTRRQVRFRLQEQGIRDIEAATLAALLERDADVATLGADTLLELGRKPVRDPSGQ